MNLNYIPKGHGHDIVWGTVRPKELRMIPKQQTHNEYWNQNTGGVNNYRSYNNPYKQSMVFGDLIPERGMKDRVGGDGIFDVIGKLPWTKIFDVGGKVLPHVLETGFKVADRFKHDPNVQNAKSKQELIEYFKHLLSQETDPKIRMELVREIGKLK